MNKSRTKPLVVTLIWAICFLLFNSTGIAGLTIADNGVVSEVSDGYQIELQATSTEVALGAFDVTIEFDPSIVAIESVDQGDLTGFSTLYYNPATFASGQTRILAYRMESEPASAQTLSIARINFHINPTVANDAYSRINIVRNALVDAQARDIPSVARLTSQLRIVRTNHVPAEPIPTLSEWGLILLFIFTGLVAILYVRKLNLQKYTTPITLLFALISLAPNLEAGVADEAGDANSDGVVDAQDADFIARSLVGLESRTLTSDQGDITGDGKVDVIDAMGIAQRATTCAIIKHVRDINLPGNVVGGQPVDLQWEVRNDGWCKAENFRLSYRSSTPEGNDGNWNGDHPSFTIAPGESTIITARVLAAPTELGYYKVYWNILDTYGAVLGDLRLGGLWADFTISEVDITPIDPCLEDPTLPFCQDNFCEQNPEDPVCLQLAICQIDPTDPSCPSVPFCEQNPSDPRCLLPPTNPCEDMSPPQFNSVQLSSIGGFRVLVTANVANADTVDLFLNGTALSVDELDRGPNEYGAEDTGNKRGTNEYSATASNMCYTATFGPFEEDVVDTRTLGSTKHCDNPCGAVADPINTYSGNFYDRAVDANVAGPGGAGLLVEREYNSLTARYDSGATYQYTNDGADREKISGPPQYFGSGWSTNLDTYLLVLDYAPVYEGAQVRFPRGQTREFIKTGGGYEPDGWDNFDKLEATGNGYRLTRKDSLEVWDFLADGRIRQITDRNGNTVTYEYQGDALARLVSSSGRSIEFTSNGDGQITQARLPESITLNYGYSNGLLTRYTNGNGNTTQYTYDSEDRLVETRKPNGNFGVRNTYNDDNQATEQIVGESERYTLAYADDLSSTVFRDAYGNRSEHTHTEDGWETGRTHPDGTTETFEFDEYANRTFYRDEAGAEWRWTYDDKGNKLTESGPLGVYKQWQYNDQNRVTRLTEKVMGSTTRDFTFAYDANQNLTQICMPLGGCASIAYDSRGLPTNLTNLNGALTVNAYDGEGDLISVTDADGHTTTFAHDGLGRITTLTKPLGNSYRYTFDNNGNLTAVDGPLDYHLGMVYDANDNTIQKVDPNGGSVTLSYDQSDNLITVANQLGFLSQYQYGLMNERTGSTDAEGRSWSYTYNNRLRVTDLNGPLNTHFGFSYNPVGKIIDAIDANGTVKHIDYNALYRPTRVIRNYRPAAASNSDTNVTTQYTYDLLGNVLTMTDPEGFTYTYEYDLEERKTGKRDPEGYEWDYSYDPMGNLLSALDPNGHSTQIEYTPTNKVARAINPEGHGVSFVYNPNGKLTDTTDARGVVTHLDYNVLDRKVQKTENYLLGGSVDHQTNVTTAWEHDPKGNVRYVTNPRGYKAELIYDAAHRLVQVVDFESGQTLIDYDKVDNRIRLTDANGNPTNYTFDDLDRLIAQTNAENETKQFGYDPMGNRTQLIEADGTVTLYEFDGVYRLNGVTQNHRDGIAPGNDVNVLTQYSYDARGLLTQILNANGHPTAFAYDKVGNMVQETDPLNMIWQYTYDGVGNKVTRTDAKGDLTSYGYYPDDELQSILYADGKEALYSYDNNNNRVSLADWLGNTSWEYDPLNRITEQNDPFQRVLAYAYDAAGNRTGMTYPDGNQVDYSFSPNNWMASMTDPADGVISYSRDKVGNILHIANPNLTETHVTLDKVYRTLTRNNTETRDSGQIVNSGFAYSYNELGHVTQVANSYGWRQPDEVTETYTYDGLHRLAGVLVDPIKNNGETVQMTYAYDPVGNRLEWTSSDNLQSQTPRDAFVKRYEYNAGNQLLSFFMDVDKQQGDITIQYRYDNNGNRINKSEYDDNGPIYGTDYAFDHENRLIEALDYQLVGHDDANRIDRAVQTYHYDGGGRRLVKSYDPKKNDAFGVDKRVEFVWDGLDPVAEYQMLNGQRTDLYRGAGNQLAMMHDYKGGTQGNMHWYHFNHKGDVVGLSKHNGNSHQNYRYDPYGGIYHDTGNRTEPQNHYTLTGKQFDEMPGKEYEEVTGLVYFGARYYDPTVGVWISQDTFRGETILPSSLHRSLYLGSDPINHFDQDGYFLDTIWDAANVIYDAGRIVKNSVEYAYGAATNNEEIKRGAVADLQEAAIDIAVDAAATLVPFVPAGTTKVARAVKKTVTSAPKPNIPQMKRLASTREDYLKIPYDGMGEHVIPRRILQSNLMPGFAKPTVKKLLDQNWNVVKPDGISTGDFYKLHYKLDRKANAFRMPDRFGKSWKGHEIIGKGSKYGVMGKLWNSPTTFKMLIMEDIAGLMSGKYWSDDDDIDTTLFQSGLSVNELLEISQCF